ncbi:MAG: glutathione S-transferase N-terminal domain-containing protein [Xanthomonadaceae bacterium]|nr:glutathione S-transferase N-terminal domain-containing protein [Xanthomonadaceae bacterium]
MSTTLATWGKRKPAATSRVRTVLTLFSGRNDLASHCARLVLAAKGVSYDLVVVDPNDPPEDLADLNPSQTLPTLVDRDLVLYDVNVIAEYLDERYPHPPLMPVDPLSRARVRLGVVRLQQDWFPFVDTIQTGTKSTAETARKRLREALMGSVPVFKAAKFFLNTEMSLADCALAPLVWRLPSLGVVLPKEAQPITDYGERIFRNPGFLRSMTDDEKALRPG